MNRFRDNSYVVGVAAQPVAVVVGFAGSSAQAEYEGLVALVRGALHWPYPLSWKPNWMSLGHPGSVGPATAAALPMTVNPELVEMDPVEPSWSHCQQFSHLYTISKRVSVTVDARVVRVAFPLYEPGNTYPLAQRNDVRTWPSYGQAISSKACVICPDVPWEIPHQPVTVALLLEHRCGGQRRPLSSFEKQD